MALATAVAGLALAGGATPAAATHESSVTTFNQCDPMTSFGDFERSVSTRTETAQDVSLDESDVFSAIVLANAGVDVDVEDLLQVEQRFERTADATQDTDFDRDDVLLALALGYDTRLSRARDIACAADVDVSTDTLVRATQTVDLDEDTVLSAIVLSKTVGGDLDLEDVADFDREIERVQNVDRDTSFDREDAFALLALGR